jgi:4-hydroxy-3-methylbut-2-enyl diphosphate reductase
LETRADLAVVVGGYNSSNTSHIVELCESRFPTYFINSEKEIVSEHEISHYNYHKKEKKITKDYLPNRNPIKIVLTSGASCPDTLVDRVMLRLLEFYKQSKSPDQILEEFETKT